MTSRSFPLAAASACIAGLLAACGPDAATPLRIPDVQGLTVESPLDGRLVAVAGIVTARFPAGGPGDSPGSIAIQDEAGDRDPATSDAIVVALPHDIDVDVGDRVEVEGRVVEFDLETRIVAKLVRVTGAGRVEPVTVTLPAPDANGLEPYEGMLVHVPGPLTVADSYDLERDGSLLLSAGGRPRVFTSRARPDPAGYRAHRAGFEARTLVLDDADFTENAIPIRFLVPAFENGPRRPVRVGDTVASVTGVLRFASGSGDSGAAHWRLMPVEAPAFLPDNPRPPLLPGPGERIRVAGFNALNFFATIDAPGAACGPGALGCRGADSMAERDRQLARLVTALAGLSADVIGIVEIENDAGQSLDMLTTALGQRDDGAWTPVHTGPIGGDAIRVGLIYNADRVRGVKEYAVLDRGVDDDFVDDRNRPVLAQTFEVVANGDRFTVAVNHLKSKGSDCDDLGDPDTGDGQGNCNRTRTRAAEAEIRWLASDPTASDDPDILVIGDLNAYRQEDPVQAFLSAGFVDVVKRSDGGLPWSYVFRGESGALDHALASPGLAAKVVAAGVWHINADEARALDYNLDYGRPPEWFDPGVPYRASDHDPVFVDIRPEPRPPEGESP